MENTDNTLKLNPDVEPEAGTVSFLTVENHEILKLTKDEVFYHGQPIEHDKGKYVIEGLSAWLNGHQHKYRDGICVYIASPYTLGDVAVNVKRQHDAFHEILAAGFYPYMPLFAHYQHLIHPEEYEKWMEWDMIWISRCNCLLRLEGESKGADREVAHAEEIGIPVFYSLEDIKKHYHKPRVAVK